MILNYKKVHELFCHVKNTPYIYTIETKQKHKAMTSNFKYQDGTETFTIKTGEVFTVEQDCNGFWGYTSNKGYNLWEAGNLPTTKSEAVKMLRQHEKVAIKNAKYN